MITRPEATSGRLTGRTLGYILLGGAGAMALGMLLPWVKVSAPILGTITKALIDGDGKLLLVLAAAIAVGAYFYLTARFSLGVRILLGSAAVLSAGFMILELINTQRILGEMGSSMSALKDNPFGAAFASAISYGFDIGAYLASIGTLAVVAATVLIFKNGPLPAAEVVQPGVQTVAGADVAPLAVEVAP